MTGLRQWVERFGTPIYLYHLERVQASCDDLRADLPTGAKLYYSLKANPHPLIARRLRQAGCRAEISSSGELAAAARAGFPGEETLFTGPGKTSGELAKALASGVRRFSVESVQDYTRLAATAERAGVIVECLLRINTARSAGLSGLRMTGTASAFGIDIDQVRSGPHRFCAPCARVVGVHFFPLSNARDERSLIAELAGSIRAAAQLRDAGVLHLGVVDLGGGFAIPYAQSGQRPRYPRLATELEPTLDRFLPGWRTGTVEIAFESGRYLVGDCGSLVCTILDVKRSAGRTFVVLDAGINHLGGMAGLGRMLPASTLSGPGGAEPHSERGTVVGPLCTPADVLSGNTAIGGLKPGSIVQIPNTGAYGLTASLVAFLSRPAPVEVVVDCGRTVAATRLDFARTHIWGADQ